MMIYYTKNFAGGRNESRRLLKRAISEYTGDPEKTERLVSELRMGEYGKPHIEGFDHFSVSHTGSIWAVLFDTRECGLDIQLGKECDFAAIARRMYAPEDAAYMSALMQGGAAADSFFRTWTRREALAKALGVSVFGQDLPSVFSDSAVKYVTMEKSVCRIEDIRFPDASDMQHDPDRHCTPQLYAAVCHKVRGYADEPDRAVFDTL